MSRNKVKADLSWMTEEELRKFYWDQGNALDIAYDDGRLTDAHRHTDLFAQAGDELERRGISTVWMP